MNYEKTADKLTARIVALIPDNPQIMDMDSCWDLFKIESFKCNDLEPSIFQANWALRKAQSIVTV